MMVMTANGATTKKKKTSSAPMALPFRQLALDEFARQFDTAHIEDMSPAKRRVVEAFLRLCVVHGMQSVSMRTLAKELDIKAPTIYSHFPGGRDEIIAESLRWHFHHFCSALVDAVRPAKDASSFLDAMIRLHFVRQVQLPESNLWDLIVGIDRSVQILPVDLSVQVAHWVDLYESLYIAVARDLGLEDVTIKVKMVNTLLEGSTRWFEPTKTAKGLSRGADQAVAISRQILGMAAS
ncbi:TetR/AcrR family transcriptional regulator [Glutamicibacter mishrai]|uniref:TetR/AcrR family transcriptional regulator n=1 Tax=Glutamicibacter mishrai TaxID=1775880 RepID=A0A6H0SG72_9MICC|nr:TetR/AcrR family transcriptional regulator [Glutamicibacter mishrai]QIV86652.1 TetR/AcrR family transcriptional regulator [Glutamicibacter mishrai]